jgi:hypothetical protein
VGSSVEIDAILQPDGSFNAIEAKVGGFLDDDVNESEFYVFTPAPTNSPTADLSGAGTPVVTLAPGSFVEFVGLLTAVSGSTLTIDGKQVHVFPNTQVAETFTTGVSYEVDGILLDDGSYNAIEVKYGTVVDNDLDDPAYKEFTPAPTYTATPAPEFTATAAPTFTPTP